ncbi:MAG: ribosome assembly cofactor RimP [Saprospiraceae bacterium]
MFLEETVREWLEEKLTEESFSGVYVVDIFRTPHKLEIYLDSDGKLDLEKCSRISRWLGHKLELADLIPEKYILEVSSTGLDRPLKLHRQYIKNIGRDVSVHLKNGTLIEGNLAEVKEDMIIISQEIIERENKKKVKKTINTIILNEDILKTFIQIKI